MANKSVFATIRGLMAPKANAWNHEGAPAYKYTDAHALAQMAVTGTFGGFVAAERPRWQPQWPLSGDVPPLSVPERRPGGEAPFGTAVAVRRPLLPTARAVAVRNGPHTRESPRSADLAPQGHDLQRAHREAHAVPVFPG